MARKCPTCKTEVPAVVQKAPFLPVCSERCKLLDLGAWLDGAYKIAGPAVEDEGSTESSDDDG